MDRFSRNIYSYGIGILGWVLWLVTLAFAVYNRFLGYGGNTTVRADDYSELNIELFFIVPGVLIFLIWAGYREWKSYMVGD